MARERGSVDSRSRSHTGTQTGTGTLESSDALPIGATARLVRVALVLLLDGALLAAGVYLIFKWRTEALQAPEEPAPVVAVAPVAPSPAVFVNGSNGPDAPTAVSLAPPPTLPLPPLPSPARLLPSTLSPPASPLPSPAAPPKRDVLPPRGGSLPSKPIEPGVMKNPHAGDATAPDAGATAEPPPPTEPPPSERPQVEQMTSGIRAVVDRHRPDILDCYRRPAKVAPLHGRLEVHIRILPGGDVEDVRVVQNGTGSDELGECLVKVMQGWRYPDPGTEAMEFVWPFTFAGQGGRRNSN